MNRIKHIALALLLTGASTAFAQNKPNIVFIMADDMGYADVGCYGQTEIQTPFIDQMAKEGLRFTQVYSGSTVCAPTRSVLMTGQHTGHTRIRGNSTQNLLPEDITLGEILQDAGYVTGAVGKWGLGEEPGQGHPSDQGFDFWYGFLNQVNAHYYYPEFMWRNKTKETLPGNLNGKRTQYAHDIMAEEALGFIKRNKNKPFFLYVPFIIPHSEMLVPDDEPSLAGYMKKYAHKDKAWRMDQEAVYGKGYYKTPTPNVNAAAMMTRMDRDIGRIFTLLKKLNLDENTIVFFTSDNGPASAGGRDAHFFDSNGPLRGIKRDLYEGGIRCPMIVRWPGHIAPDTVDTSTIWTHWDVMPTLAELTGAQTPANIDGLSVLPTILGKKQQLPNRMLYWEFHEGSSKQSVRWGNWKAVRGSPVAPLQLFDLSQDVSEEYNIAAKHPQVIAAISAYLKTARTESEAWPLKVRPSKKKKKK